MFIDLAGSHHAAFNEQRLPLDDPGQQLDQAGLFVVLAVAGHHYGSQSGSAKSQDWEQTDGALQPDHFPGWMNQSPMTAPAQAHNGRVERMTGLVPACKVMLLEWANNPATTTSSDHRRRRPDIVRIRPSTPSRLSRLSVY